MERDILILHDRITEEVHFLFLQIETDAVMGRIDYFTLKVPALNGGGILCISELAAHQHRNEENCGSERLSGLLQGHTFTYIKAEMDHILRPVGEIKRPVPPFCIKTNPV